MLSCNTKTYFPPETKKLTQQHNWKKVPPTLAAHGLEELFFQLCCCVSFLIWQEIGFGVTNLRI
jgi:hypothetical protein